MTLMACAYCGAATPVYSSAAHKKYCSQKCRERAFRTFHPHREKKQTETYVLPEIRHNWRLVCWQCSRGFWVRKSMTEVTALRRLPVCPQCESACYIDLDVGMGNGENVAIPTAWGQKVWDNDV